MIWHSQLLTKIARLRDQSWMSPHTAALMMGSIAIYENKTMKYDYISKSRQERFKIDSHYAKDQGKVEK